MAVCHWLARLDSQLPQGEFSVLFNLRPNVIFLPHRHATGGHDAVRNGSGVSQGLPDLCRVIALGFQQDWLASQGYLQSGWPDIEMPKPTCPIIDKIIGLLEDLREQNTRLRYCHDAMAQGCALPKPPTQDEEEIEE